MNILHIVNDYRNGNLYEQLFINLSEKVNLNQTVFVPFKKKLDLEYNKPYEIIHKACYSDIDRFFFKNKSNKVFNSLETNVNLSKVDIIHAHTLFSNGYVAYKAYKKFKTPYIVSIRGTDVEFFFKKFWWLRELGKEILINASLVIFLSPVLKMKTFEILKGIDKEISSKTVIKPNAINQFWINNLYNNRKFNSKKNILKLIQVGWINENKNLLSTVKAIKYLNDMDIIVNLNVVGSPEYEKDEKYLLKVKKYIEHNNLGEQIEFSGRLTADQLILKYRESDIFILPSKRETFGLVYLEAMSQNLPIIYSENQGVDGFYSSSEGLKINPNSHIDIAEKIIEMSSKLVIYKDNYLKVKNQSWDSIAEEFQGYYYQVNDCIRERN